MTRDGLKPRDYAAKILTLPTLEDRRKYLADNVPLQWQELVKTHVRAMWGKRKNNGHSTK